MGKRLRGIIIAGLVFFSMFLAKPVRAEEKDYIDINANLMEMFEDRKLIVFNGEVVAKKQNINLYCDKLSVYYTESPVTKKREVDFLIAEGHVKVIQTNRVATGNTAKYFKKEDKIILEGSPAILKEESGNEVRGDKITFFISENKSVVEGNRPKVIFRLGE